MRAASLGCAGHLLPGGWGFTDTAQVAEAQLACGYPTQHLLPLGRQSASAAPQKVRLLGWMYAAVLPAEARKESGI